jgi:cell division septation protein DedD
MLTIRPSTVTDNADDPPQAVENPDDHKKRIPYVWIPATLGIGLLIAGVYLGGRIVKAHPQAKPQIVHLTLPENIKGPAATVELPPTPDIVRPEPLTAVSPADGIPLIAPQTGERYIQVGALNQEATRRFVERLRKEELDPHVAQGPTPELMRVLIGPFTDRDALTERKAQLEAEGIATFVRRY